MKVSEEVSIPAGITSAMRNKKATHKSGFCCCCALSGLHETMHRNNKKMPYKVRLSCCTLPRTPRERHSKAKRLRQSRHQQCLRSLCRGLQGKGAVKRSGCVNPATSNVCDLSAEDSKGKALSGADLILRSSQSRLKNFPLYTLITWPHLHLISSFLLVEPLITHSPRDVVATSYAYDFLTTNEAL